MAGLKQLQLRYDPLEDRLALRLSTGEGQEFRFWLTRRYTTLLLAVLDKHQAADPEVAEHDTAEARRAVRAFKQEAASAGAAFGGDFEAAPELPLGDAPILAFRLDYRISEASLNLTIAPKDGAGIAFTLDRNLSLNLGTMLAQALAQADWVLTIVDAQAQAQAQALN
ncbi:MAG: hypothetical protein VX766_07300 [Pseudomonadota bacterium]|nr:hypothetical protein [Pseudomonadota bacterium]